MLTNVLGAKCVGIDAIPVTVEVDIAGGIGIHLVGLADAAVRESLLRTMTALQSMGYRIPGKKIVINLAPADLHKKGSGYDLPIAIGIIAASSQEEFWMLDKYLIMGELGLDGSVRDVPGALPMVEMACNMGLKGCILPYDSALEAVDYEGVDLYGVKSLGDAIKVLMGDVSCLICREAKASPPVPVRDVMDFAEIVGQEGAKRGMEVAAAGGHNALLVGPPGAGKSSLSRATANILPPLTLQEALQTSKIYSVAGKGGLRNGLVRSRPFRSPHYSTSIAALIGGGSDTIIPGEISLAHNGVLFLDEFCEIPRRVMEALRGPLEDRKVSVSRLKTRVEFPADFMLIAATNPCPCGYYGEGNRCTCTPARRDAYLSRLSGPLMDRIDIHLWLKPVDARSLVRRQKAESSAEVAARVMKARQIQLRRFEGKGIFTNAAMTGRLIDKYCKLSPSSQKFLEQVIERDGLSARACGRILKLARTIADLESAEDITLSHLSEAVGYRFLDKKTLSF